MKGWQIKVHPDHRAKTAFITPQGLFQFKRCPFGFTNSPAKYQRAMNEIFSEGLYRRCVIYVDDILVMGRHEQELLNNLDWVFSKCRESNVKLKGSKCQYLKTEVDFLGYRIAFNSIRPIKGKYSAIQGQPRTKKEVQSIIGCYNYYARFIEDYSEVSKPSRDSIKNDNDEVRWTDEVLLH